MTDIDDPQTYGIDTEIVAVTHPFESMDGIETADEVACVAARNDYSPTDRWVGELSYDEIMGNVTTEALIRKLLRQPGHFGPFEHISVTFAIKGVSRVTMAQITRHRLASFDVQSSRYTMPEIEFIHDLECGERPLTDLERYVVIPKLARELGEEREFLIGALESFKSYSDLYTAAVDAGHSEGRAKEDARYLLPKCLRVNMVMTVNLRTLMHIADMRAAADSQWEIRLLTGLLLDTAAEIAPITMEVYEEKLKGRADRLAP